MYGFGSVLNWLNFGFQVEMGSILSVVGSGVISGRSAWVIWIESFLPDLVVHNIIDKVQKDIFTTN